MASYQSLFGGSYRDQIGKRPATLPGQPGATATNATANQTAQPTAPAQPTQAGAVQPQMTFAQMQQRGMARPAPGMVTGGAMPQNAMMSPSGGMPQSTPVPQAAPVAQYGGSAQADAARVSLAQMAQQAMAQPTRYDTQTFQTLRDTATNDLNADFARQAQQLDERLAARGLYDSTIAANDFRDLGGQQARAMAGLNANLLQDAAATQMSDRLAAAGLSSQLAQLAGSQDLAAFEANRVGSALNFENQMRSAEFGEGQRQFDRSQGLAEQLGLGSLGLDAQRLAQEGEQFGQTMQLSRDELALRGDLGAAEQQIARERMAQDGTLAMAEQNIERERLAQQGAQFGQQLGFDRERFGAEQNQATLERQLRERLGLSELSGTYQGADGQTYNTVARDRLAADTRMAENDLFLRLAQALSGLTPDQLRNFRTGTTTTPPPVGGSPPGPPATGGGNPDPGTPGEGEPSGDGVPKPGGPPIDAELETLIRQMLGGR